MSRILITCGTVVAIPAIAFACTAPSSESADPARSRGENDAASTQDGASPAVARGEIDPRDELRVVTAADEATAAALADGAGIAGPAVEALLAGRPYTTYAEIKATIDDAARPSSSATLKPRMRTTFTCGFEREVTSERTSSTCRPRFSTARRRPRRPHSSSGCMDTMATAVNF